MSEIVTCMVLIGILISGSVTDLYAQSWKDDPNQHVMVDMRCGFIEGSSYLDLIDRMQHVF